MSTAADFREWKPDEWFDRGFLQSVPSPARKMFLRVVRPLTADFSRRVIASLFAGIKQPFHYGRASSWMARLLRTELALPATASLEQRQACLRDKLDWPPMDVVLLVYHQPDVYATCWASFLQYFREGWLDLDTMLVCHPKAREVVLFWENAGPIFGKRGPRHLPCPCWGSGEPLEEGAEV